MDYFERMSPLEQEFFTLTKDFDLQDWCDMRDDNYWWVIDPITKSKRTRSKYEKLDLIRYYIAKGVPKPPDNDKTKTERM